MDSSLAELRNGVLQLGNVGQQAGIARVCRDVLSDGIRVQFDTGFTALVPSPPSFMSLRSQVELVLTVALAMREREDREFIARREAVAQYAALLEPHEVTL